MIGLLIFYGDWDTACDLLLNILSTLLIVSAFLFSFSFMKVLLLLHLLFGCTLLAEKQSVLLFFICKVEYNLSLTWLIVVFTHFYLFLILFGGVKIVMLGCNWSFFCSIDKFRFILILAGLKYTADIIGGSFSQGSVCWYFYGDIFKSRWDIGFEFVLLEMGMEFINLSYILFSKAF